jgi:hypothetical protein
MYAENQEARKAAARDALKNPMTVINGRVRSSSEYASAVERCAAAITAFYSRDLTDEQFTAEFRARGGRTKIRCEIVSETLAGETVFGSELAGNIPMECFISLEDMQLVEIRALRSRE